MVSLRESRRDCVFLQNGDCGKIVAQECRNSPLHAVANVFTQNCASEASLFRDSVKLPKITCNLYPVAMLLEDVALSVSKFTSHTNQNNGV